jgi:sugar/nucleoside kinase (ribokinase family)
MVTPDFDLLVVGELNPDLILTGDVTPKFGQVEQLLDDATLTIGSSSAIFACGAARLGLRVAFIGKVGDDEFGRFMRSALEARGVDTSGVVVDPGIKTGLTVVLSRGNDRAILTYSGSIGALCLSEVDLRILVRARHLHLGSYFMLDALRPDVSRLFEIAGAYKLTTSLDTNYDPAEQWNGDLPRTLRRAHVFLPNETELTRIAGVPDVAGALAKLSSLIPLIAVKRGPHGATARRGNEVFDATSIPVNVVDTTGAGDSFDAGFIYGYLNGWDVGRSLRLACVCGALSTRAAGGTTAQPTLEEALAYL